jgi:CBS domain-containing protein
MKVHEIMTAHPHCVAPDNTLVEAAGLMRQLDVGALPICDNDRLAGMVTDRDIVLRGTADGRDPNTATVRDVMSEGILYVFADQDVEEAAHVMEQKQIRRLPVLNREKRMVGIVSLGDVATSSNPAFSGNALRDVSQPKEPSARQRRLMEQSEPNRMPDVPGEPQRPRTAKKARSSSTRGSSAQAKSARSSRTTQRRKQSTAKGKKTRTTRGRGSARTSRSRRVSSTRAAK